MQRYKLDVTVPVLGTDYRVLIQSERSERQREMTPAARRRRKVGALQDAAKPVYYCSLKKTL